MKTLLIFALAVSAFAQKSATPNPNVQYLNNSGAVCAGCKLYTYIAGSTTFQATYTTAGGGASNTNPVVLDSAGRANVWTTPGQSYHFVLCTSAGGASACTPSGVAYWDVDNIPGGTILGNSNVTANYVVAGPTSGAAAPLAARALVSADIPNNAANTSGNAATATALAANPTDCAANTFANAIAASGNLTCASVGPAAMTSQAARSVIGNATAAAAVPTATTTVDALAYQVAEIPSFVFVAGDFTTSGVGTALETITGLTWTIPANTAINMPFTCSLRYSQAVANAAVAFGIQDVSVSPTNIAGQGIIYTNTTASTHGDIAGLNTTTATAIVSATPAATATGFIALVNGFIEAPSNSSSSAIRIMVSTATAGDLVTVSRGSFCRLN